MPPKTPIEPEVFDAGDGIDYRPRMLYRPPISSATIGRVAEYPGQDRHSPVQPHEDIQMAKAKKTAVKKTVAKKVAKTKSGTPANKPGVIAMIVEIISRETGASAQEILAVLVRKFPDREPAGMRKTIGIQASRNASSKEKDEKRGIVYFNRRRSAHASA
jgi:hypothetical protein